MGRGEEADMEEVKVEDMEEVEGEAI